VNPFRFHRPASLTEAFSVVESHSDAHLVAGGTATMLLMKQGLLQPAHVISLRAIPDLSFVRSDDAGLRLGAMCTLRSLELSPAVRAYDAALADALASVATVRIRTMATLGGNLVHADPAQDPPPMLIALRGVVVLASADGVREIPLDEFFVDYFESAIRPGEVLTSVRLPPKPAHRRTAYVKYLPRSVDDYATVAVAAAVDVSPDGTVEDARIVLGAAAPTVVRARSAEDAVRGLMLTPQRIAQAASAAADAADPLDDARGSATYKKAMVKVWVRRVLERLAGH
jgi:carbon-monoxide dehydrogenase medium subunit